METVHDNRTLTTIGLASVCGSTANSAKPDQKPQNAASDNVLHFA